MWKCLQENGSQFVSASDKNRYSHLTMFMCVDIQILTLGCTPKKHNFNFPDDIFKWIFVNENAWISMKISLKFVPKVLICNIPALDLKQWRLDYWLIYASRGLNELMIGPGNTLCIHFIHRTVLKYSSEHFLSECDPVIQTGNSTKLWSHALTNMQWTWWQAWQTGYGVGNSEIKGKVINTMRLRQNAAISQTTFSNTFS